jgi:endoglucanase
MNHFETGSATKKIAIALMAVLTCSLLGGCHSGFQANNSLSISNQSSLSAPAVPNPSPAPTPPGPANVVPPPTNSPVTSGHLALPGVNLSGGEYNLGNQNICASVDLRIAKSGCILSGWDYIYPSNAEMDYYAAKGLKVIRLPFDGNRVQLQREGPLNSTELMAIDNVVKYAGTKGLMVLLDPHNYGTLNEYDLTGQLAPRVIGVDPLMPASKFADLWSKLATHYLTSSNVIFGLMNEPHLQTASQWHAAAIVAIDAIRATGATQKILIPGTSWTGAHSWITSGNAAEWTGFTDMNFAFEVHQYLDSDSSGTHNSCMSGSGSSALVAFTNWARANSVRGFLGEVGWATDSVCMAEGNSLMSYMSANADTWLGYSYWAGGAWSSSYMFTLEPSGLGTSLVTDRPQISILAK